MQSTSTTLGVILRRVKEGSLRIPRFQRPFIWKESQVKSLVDSISRSYPIGSLLLLDKNPELELDSRSIEAEIRSEHPAETVLQELDSTQQADVQSYILDGQQRTTSIARVFLNAHPQKVYYFDLRSILDQHRSEETSWITVRRRGKTSPDRKDNNRLLRADISLDQKKAEVYVSEYIEDSGDFPEFKEDRRGAREASAYIKGVFETIRKYQIPIVSLDREGGIESICRVFETINSTGTRLRTFDLAVARFYPNPDLRTLWEDALEGYPILGTFDVDPERVLQVLALTGASENESRPDGAAAYLEASRKAQLSLKRSVIGDGWSSAVSSLKEAYDYARLLGARRDTIPNHNVIAAIAAVRNVLRRRGGVSQSWRDEDLVRRWYFGKVLRAGSSQASNYRLAQDFRDLLAYATTGARLTVDEVKLNVDILCELRPTDARYKALQCILASTVREDLTTGQRLAEESRLEDHHIFPRAAHKRHGIPVARLDSICNRIYILAESNRALGESYPDDYLVECARAAASQGTLEGFVRRLGDCMVPNKGVGDLKWCEELQVSAFELFLRKRALLIVARVREVIGNALTDTSSDEDEVLDED